MRQQQGAALIVGLVLLLVLTVLGVSGMNMAVLELNMTGNSQARQMAFQAAETGIDVALSGPVNTAAATTYTDVAVGDGISQYSASIVCVGTTRVPDGAYSESGARHPLRRHRDRRADGARRDVDAHAKYLHRRAERIEFQLQPERRSRFLLAPAYRLYDYRSQNHGTTHQMACARHTPGSERRVGTDASADRERVRADTGRYHLARQHRRNADIPYLRELRSAIRAGRSQYRLHLAAGPDAACRFPFRRRSGPARKPASLVTVFRSTGDSRVTRVRIHGSD